MVTATTVSVTNTSATPVAVTTIAGKIPHQYLVSALTCAYQNRPAVMNAEPAMSSSLGPTRGSTWLTIPEPMMMIRLNGRYATPDFKELKPITPWMKNVR